MKLHGFTLLEMMIALAVLAILATVGIPSFSAARASSRLTAVANEFVATVQLARSEAIKRNRVVKLCVSTDGETCAASVNWNNGWVVQTVPDSVGEAARIIAAHQGAGSGVTMKGQNSVQSVLFSPTGLGATPAVLTVCSTAFVVSQAREIRVTASGGARVTRTEASSC